MSSPAVESDAVNRVSFMLSVPDTARADVTLTPERTYYRFATEDTMEEGELKAIADDFQSFTVRLLEVFKAGASIPSSIEPVRFSLFVNNVHVRPEILNNATLRSFIRIMAESCPEMSFLKGFN